MEAHTDLVRMQRPRTRSQRDRQRKKLRAWRRGYQHGVLSKLPPPPLRPPPGLDVTDPSVDEDEDEQRHDWIDELVRDMMAQYHGDDHADSHPISECLATNVHDVPRMEMPEYALEESFMVWTNGSTGRRRARVAFSENVDVTEIPWNCEPTDPAILENVATLLPRMTTLKSAEYEALDMEEKKNAQHFWKTENTFTAIDPQDVPVPGLHYDPDLESISFTFTAAPRTTGRRRKGGGCC